MLRDNLSIINIIFECRALCYDRRGTIGKVSHFAKVE